MKPADDLVIPPHVEHDGVFHGASSYAAMKFDLGEVATLFAGEPRLCDPASWESKNCYPALPSTGMAAIARLATIVNRLAQHKGELPPASADFWKRSVADCLAANIVSSLPPDERRSLPSAMRLVHKTERYVEAIDGLPVHVSEICTALRVSRRTLHRAFREVFGIGPMAFLRHKRLCTVHTILKDHRPDDVTIAALALHHGFIDPGRFSRHYRALFGEFPSQTLDRRNQAKK
jgi:AraC family ethanolamine operon transcriptional activator